MGLPRAEAAVDSSFDFLSPPSICLTMASTSARSDTIYLDSIGTRASSVRTGAESVTDEILRASEAHDAEVPEGGYGWGKHLDVVQSER